MKQLTKEQALKFFESEAYKELPDDELVVFQLEQDKLCMPWSYFHEKVEAVLGRPVYTHEFGLNRNGLILEARKIISPPSFQEIIDMIPKDKQVIIVEAPDAS